MATPACALLGTTGFTPLPCARERLTRARSAGVPSTTHASGLERCVHEILVMADDVVEDVGVDAALFERGADRAVQMIESAIQALLDRAVTLGDGGDGHAGVISAS